MDEESYFGGYCRGRADAEAGHSAENVVDCLDIDWADGYEAGYYAVIESNHWATHG